MSVHFCPVLLFYPESFPPPLPTGGVGKTRIARNIIRLREIKIIQRLLSLFPVVRLYLHSKDYVVSLISPLNTHTKQETSIHPTHSNTTELEFFNFDITSFFTTSPPELRQEVSYVN